jgi:hypothetical protein
MRAHRLDVVADFEEVAPDGKGVIVDFTVDFGKGVDPEHGHRPHCNGKEQQQKEAGGQAGGKGQSSDHQALLFSAAGSPTVQVALAIVPSRPFFFIKKAEKTLVGGRVAKL